GEEGEGHAAPFQHPGQGGDDLREQVHDLATADHHVLRFPVVWQAVLLQDLHPRGQPGGGIAGLQYVPDHVLVDERVHPSPPRSRTTVLQVKHHVKRHGGQPPSLGQGYDRRLAQASERSIFDTAHPE
ncbi:MAG: hypothetical protein H5T98_02250, partial [Syntrophomonadaceae bacterium]|nr:hypothetical protein [Syntrophomonadaceae bacterium]